MKRLFALVVLLSFGFISKGQQTAPVPVVLGSRVLVDGTRSLLISAQQFTGQADELRVELPGKASQTAVLMSGPAGWKLERDGDAIRIAGMPHSPPLRFRVSLFDVKELKEARVKIRLKGKDILSKEFPAASLPSLQAAGSTNRFLDLPVVITPGDTIEVRVLDPARTPADGQWVIAGVPATPSGPNHVNVRLPDDLQPGTPVRVSFFDAWGERLVDALSTEETVVTATPAAPTPQITGCAEYSFIDQSLCVCGNFPEQARRALRIDGQPATVLSASQHVIHLLLPSSLNPGSHTISGDTGAGFPATARATTTALRLKGTLDRNKLTRGQSTELHLAIEGAAQPMKLSITNKTPGVISMPGGNYQEVNTSGGSRNEVERRVNATGRGEFVIEYKLEAPPCPCQQQARQEHPSTASRPAPVVVPRRVLATIAADTPFAMLANAQAIALANGLSVVEVNPLVSANAALVIFEIQDGIAAIAKAAALAADPRVTLTQPDFVYDTSQADSSQGAPSYGLQLIGADLIQNVSKGDGVRVGVIDAGIDLAHASLLKKVVDYTDVTRTGWTPDAHGTLVAGVIAGEPSGSGLGGVAPGVQLVAVKSCVAESVRLASARCWSSTLAQGIDLLNQKDVQVMNLSVGGPEDKLLARLVDASVRKGIAVVSAAGNDGPAGKPSYPAAFDNVIAMTAVDATNRLYPRATRGSFVDLAAPGVDVVSTGPGGKQQLFSGTSAATAFGSGAVALLLRQNKNLTQVELLTLLRDTAKDLGTAGPDTEFGYGLLDVCRALVKLSNRRIACK